MIDNKNRIRKSDLALNKYWATQGGYFRLTNTVELGMVITDENLLLCHVVSEKSKENTISMRE